MHCAVLSCSVMSNSLWPMDCSLPGNLIHGDSPGQNIGVGCHALLQGIFPTQGLNPGLLHCRQILYCLRNPQIQWLALLLYWLYFSGTQPARSPRCVCYDLSKRLVKAMVFPGFPGSSVSRESTCNAGDMGSIPGLGRYPGGGHGNPLQCSCLESAHGQRSLAGYSPWGRKGSDMTERLSTHSFSSSHVWMWELNHKVGWASKNWCFWIVVLEKTLDSALDSKEIKPVNSKGNQP